MSSWSSVEECAAPLLPCTPPVSILVQNAGLVIGDPVDEVAADAVEELVSVNLTAHFRLLRQFLPGMLARDDGVVVSVSSMMGLMGGSRLAPYCASKWALVGLDEALRMELRERRAGGVRTLLVCPYVVRTGMFAGAQCEGSDCAVAGRPDVGPAGRACSTCWRGFWRRVRGAMFPELEPADVARTVVDSIVAAATRRATARC